MELYRVSKEGKRWFAVKLSGDEIGDNNQDTNEINALLESGTAVLIVDNLEEASEIVGEEITLID